MCDFKDPCVAILRASVNTSLSSRCVESNVKVGLSPDPVIRRQVAPAYVERGKDCDALVGRLVSEYL